MYNLTRRACAVGAVAVLTLGLSGCGKGSTPVADSVTSTVASAVASSVPSSSSTALAGSSVSGTASTSSPASSPSGSLTPTGDCKKVRFALHAGLGTGAVHRYLWKPFQDGTFKSGASGQRTAIVKAALAGAFALHEFKVALQDIKGCPGSQALVSTVQGAFDKATALAASLKSGKLDATALADINGRLTSIQSQAKAAGIDITEADPSSTQLLTGGGTGD
jgi:hypothetical protein